MEAKQHSPGIGATEKQRLYFPTKKYKFVARVLIYIEFVLMPGHYRLTMKLFWIFRGPFVGVPA